MSADFFRAIQNICSAYQQRFVTYEYAPRIEVSKQRTPHKRLKGIVWYFTTVFKEKVLNLQCTVETQCISNISQTRASLFSNQSAVDGDLRSRVAKSPVPIFAVLFAEPLTPSETPVILFDQPTLKAFVHVLLVEV